MTTHWNPMYYLRHAWENTNSWWGKAAIVLFYAFVWINILWAIQIVIAPTLGFECWAAAAPESEKLLVSSFLRQYNIMTIGFFLYADRGGIKVWNVAMVLIVWAACAFTYMATIGPYSKFEAYADCVDEAYRMQKICWYTLLWAVLAMVSSYMDFKQEGGTTGETTPLV